MSQVKAPQKTELSRKSTFRTHCALSMTPASLCSSYQTATDVLSAPRLTPYQQLSKPILFGSADTLKVTLTAQEGKTAKRPHQAFLLVQDQTGKLDVSYPFSVKESGKAVVSIVSLSPSDPDETKESRAGGRKKKSCNSGQNTGRHRLHAPVLDESQLSHAS